MDNLYFRQVEKSDPLKELVALYIQDTVRKFIPKSYAKLKIMVTRHLQPKGREKDFSTRDRLGETPDTVVVAVQGEGREKEKGRWQSMGSPKVYVPEDKRVVSSMIQQRKEHG